MSTQPFVPNPATLPVSLQVPHYEPPLVSQGPEVANPVNVDQAPEALTALGERPAGQLYVLLKSPPHLLRFKHLAKDEILPDVAIGPRRGRCNPHNEKRLQFGSI
jgi:hypothetical protein